jgi:hypothetical protein
MEESEKNQKYGRKRVGERGKEKEREKERERKRERERERERERGKIFRTHKNL